MNKRAKGNKLQNFVSEFYAKKGYSIHNQKSVSKQIKPGLWVSLRNDIFGAFDVIASNNIEIKFIQVTAHSSIKEKLNKILSVNLPYDKVVVEIWQYLNNGRWKIFNFNGKELREIAEIQRKKFLLIQEQSNENN